MSLPSENKIEVELAEVWENYQKGHILIDDVYVTMMPFCLRVCSRVCGKYIEVNDEEASVARMAFLEAIESYDPEKGTVSFFFGQVIRSRIIDYKRKEKKQRAIPFSAFEDASDVEAIDDQFYDQIIDDLARKQEVEKFQSLLSAFDITFQELRKVSPRQRRTREQAKRIACFISEDEEICDYLFLKKQIPIGRLENKWGVNRKIVDRYRKYIIAGVLINTYELSYLKTYVMPEERRKNS